MSLEQNFESETSDDGSYMSIADETERSNINSEEFNASIETLPTEVGGLEIPHEMEDFRRVLTPLSKDQLVELLAGACIGNQEIQQRVFSVICESRSHRRLYIKNLPFSASTESVIELFSQFGDVEEGIVLRKDGKSRGYAFVTFKTIESALLACRSPVTMNGRFLMVKLAADPFPFETKRSDAIRRKLFVRNLGFETNEESLSAVLGQYGELEESVILRKKSGESKGYGFVTFTSAEATIKALQQPHHLIDGRLVFVHQAVEGKARALKNKENHPPNSSKQAHSEGRDLSLGLLNNPSQLLALSSSLADFHLKNGGLQKDLSFLHFTGNPNKGTNFSTGYAGTSRVLFDEYLNHAKGIDSNYDICSNLMNGHKFMDNGSDVQGNCHTSMRFYTPKDPRDLKVNNSTFSNSAVRSSNSQQSSPELEIPAMAGLNALTGISMHVKSTEIAHNMNNDDLSERIYSNSAKGSIFPHTLDSNLANGGAWQLPKCTKTRQILSAQSKAPKHDNLTGNLPPSAPWMVLNDFKTDMGLREEMEVDREEELGVPNTDNNEFGGGFAFNFYYKESPQFPVSNIASWNNHLDRFGCSSVSDYPFLKDKNFNKKCESKRTTPPRLILDTTFTAF